MKRSIEIDLATNEMVYTLKSDGGELSGASLARLEDINLELGYTLLKRYRIIENDPLSAQSEFSQSALMRRGDWEVRIQCRTRLTSTEDVFQFSGDLEAFEGDTEVRHHQWVVSIPREHL